MDEHERLKHLLLGEELAEQQAQQRRIAALEAGASALPAQLPELLPELLQRGQRGEGRARLAQALAVPVADALGTAVQQQRQSIVDALFPVIGPAIRKAIAESLRDFTDTFNRALESSFTLHGLRWRLESWRTGLPYADVVLRHTLRFRLDHLFLIERDSGLVLMRESAADLAELDADAIAGMLTAIGDFVRDSVSADGDSTLDSASVGEHLVWVLQGPRANLAAFLRGVPPPVLRNELRRRLELIHAELEDPQLALQADAPHVAAALQRNLRLDHIEASLRAETVQQRASPRRWPLLLLLLAAWAALAWWGWGEWQWRERMGEAEHLLQAWPGLHVDGIEHERGRRLRVRGLIDADAQPPRAALEALLPAGALLELDLRGYVSGDDAVVLARARRQLQPPDTVRLKVHAGQLQLQGDAPAPWVEQTLRQAGWIAGVQRVDAAGLRAQDDAQAPLRAEWDQLRAALPQQRVHFVRELELRDAEELRALLATATRLGELGAALQRPLHLLCRGHNDEPGSNATNLDLRARRARWLCEQLAKAGFAADTLRAAPGAPDPNLPTIDARAATLRPDTAAAEEE